MKRPILLLVATVLLISPAFGDGSIEWAQLAPLFAENPTLRSFIDATLEVSPGGSARRFGGQYRLGGARISPYHFDAHRKGVPGPYDLVITICTVPTFFDQAGQSTTWDVAYSFTERLSFIAINQKGKQEATCPDWIGDP